jgi:cytoskeletal protein RodZ
MMHPKAERRGRRVASIVIRSLGVLAFCVMLLFVGQAASWATATPDLASSGRQWPLEPSSSVLSSATGSPHRSVSSSTASQHSDSGASSLAPTAATAEPPTADEVRQQFADLAPAVLLALAALCATNLATLFVLIGKK